MAGLYSYYLPPLVLTPAQVNIPQLVNTGNRLGGWLLVQNNSPYKIQAQLPGSAKLHPIDPQTVDKIAVNTGDQQIYILPLTLLPGAAPSSQIDIQVYPGPDPENEPPGTYPMALSRQTAPTSGAATFGFSVQQSFAAIAGPISVLNIFNPLNSGVNATIYSALISAPIANSKDLTPAFGFNAGLDLNFAFPANVFSNNSNGGLSKMHVTWATDVANVATNVLKSVDFVNGVFEMNAFPQQRLLVPGVNFVFKFFGFPTSGNVTEVLEWTEQ